MIDERKFSNEKDEKRDLLSNFINANEELLADGEQRLGEMELIGMGSALSLPAQSLTRLPFRKHVHVLRRWTRGEGTLTYVGRRSISTRAIDIRAYSFLRSEHASRASRRTRSTAPTHSRRSPRWSPTSKRTRPSTFEISDLNPPTDLRRYPET